MDGCKRETESFGVNYERYALAQRIQRIAKKYDIKTVCEIPAVGAKAAPSLYSLGFGQGGCDVTLINGDLSMRHAWEHLGLGDRVNFQQVEDIIRTPFADNTFDLVWNFAFIPAFPDPIALLTEMRRISRRYVALFCVNRRNVGFGIHRMVHRFTKIPWTHGDITYNAPRKLKRFMIEQGLIIQEVGVVDCPVWPDSLGFRDVRLHRMGGYSGKIQWDVPILRYMKTGKVPTWIKVMWAWEQIPIPLFMKHFYSHLFYVIGKK